MNKQNLPNLLAAAASVCLFNGVIHAQAPAEYKPIRRSLFLASELERNPFCPIGWVKPTAVAALTNETVEVADINPAEFVLTAVLLGRPPLVVINGREYSEGEFIILTPGGPRSKIQVQQVLDGQAILRYMNKEYPIYLQRRESIKKEAPAPKLNLQQQE